MAGVFKEAVLTAKGPRPQPETDHIQMAKHSQTELLSNPRSRSSH